MRAALDNCLGELCVCVPRWKSSLLWERGGLGIETQLHIQSLCCGNTCRKGDTESRHVNEDQVMNSCLDTHLGTPRAHQCLRLSPSWGLLSVRQLFLLPAAREDVLFKIGNVRLHDWLASIDHSSSLNLMIRPNELHMKNCFYHAPKFLMHVRSNNEQTTLNSYWSKTCFSCDLPVVFHLDAVLRV